MVYVWNVKSFLDATTGEVKWSEIACAVSTVGGRGGTTRVSSRACYVRIATPSGSINARAGEEAPPP